VALNHPRFSSNGTGKGPEPAKAALDERNRRAAAILAPRYDQLNRLWADAEARLRAMQAPRYVWTDYRTEDIDPENPYSSCHCHCLGLVKVRGEWRLCIGDYIRDDYQPRPYDPESPMNWKPILDCSVEERVEAAPHIGKLREEIVKSAEHYTVKVDEAVAHLTKALEQF